MLAQRYELYKFVLRTVGDKAVTRHLMNFRFSVASASGVFWTLIRPFRPVKFPLLVTKNDNLSAPPVLNTTLLSSSSFSPRIVYFPLLRCYRHLQVVRSFPPPSFILLVTSDQARASPDSKQLDCFPAQTTRASKSSTSTHHFGLSTSTT